MKKKSNLLLTVLVLIALVVAGRFGLLPASDESAPASKPAQSVQTADARDTNAKAVPDESGEYTDRDNVAAYLNAYGHLPSNYITKKEAEKLGLGHGRTLDEVAPGKSIGGDHFGNYENLLPDANWRECDIDYVRGSRNARRIVYSDDGQIYYTHDHYESFERLY